MRGTGIRRPILAVALVGAVIVAALVVWLVLTLQPNDRILAEGTRTNLLLVGSSETDAGRTAHEIAVMSWHGDGSVVFLIVPEAVSIKRDDGTLDELGAIHAQLGVEGTRQAVETLLGIGFDGVLEWREDAIARLVDEIGGVPLTVEEDTVYRLSEAGNAEIEIRAGEQTLTGAETLAYLRGSSAVVRTVRQAVCLRAIVEGAFVLRDDRSIRATVRALEPLLETNLSLSTLQRIASALGRIDPATLRVQILPTQTASVDGAPIVTPRAVETERFVATLIRGLELLTPTEVRVAVFNGNGVRLGASRAAEYLRARGFEVTRIANAESFDYPTSYVVVLTDEAKAWVLRDALPGEVRIVYPDGFADHYDALVGLVPFGTDLLLIVGAGMEVG